MYRLIDISFPCEITYTVSHIIFVFEMFAACAEKDISIEKHQCQKSNRSTTLESWSRCLFAVTVCCQPNKIAFNSLSTMELAHEYSWLCSAVYSMWLPLWYVCECVRVGMLFGFVAKIYIGQAPGSTSATREPLQKAHSNAKSHNMHIVVQGKQQKKNSRRANGSRRERNEWVNKWVSEWVSE